MRTIELLAPAKNLEVGIAAIDHGADAVYVGASAFGARAAASNSVDDIAKLVEYAHQFHVKVYVTINTILYDNELDDAVALIWKLYEIHVDALIIQDLGLLECDLPPIEIHASTQLNNRTAEKVDFLEKVGFSQVVLARELNLQQIKEIASKTTVPLEYFVHGALCVCYNGQCYMSEHATGRSGNRGECSQMCRHKYTLQGLGEEKQGYFLSTKDLHLGNYVEQLIDAGISSFKIEGRLKDADYVKNVTAALRKKIDAVLAKRKDLQRSSYGLESFSFTPHIEKTFSRGFTTYFVEKRHGDIANIRSPKSQGEYIGKVTESFEQKGNQRGKNSIRIKSSITLHNGDGLCFFNEKNELTGVQVNSLNGQLISLNKNIHVPVGTDIWRNFDIEFQKKLEQSSGCRKIPVSLNFSMEGNEMFAEMSIDSGEKATIAYPIVDFAKNEAMALSNLRTQMLKMGDTIFEVASFSANFKQVPFVPIAQLNELRRNLCEQLRQNIISSFEVKKTNSITKNELQYPLSEPLDYRLNVANKKSQDFYKRHGVEVTQRAFELEHRLNVPLMTTKYCIRYQMKACKKGNAEPIYLSDNSHRFRVEFDCDKCEMNIYAE